VDRLGVRRDEIVAAKGGVGSFILIIVMAGLDPAIHPGRWTRTAATPGDRPLFEPESDLERMLMRAVTHPAERPGFARALMDAQIFVMPIANGGPVVPGPDGSISFPAQLALPRATRGEEGFLPFFTAPSRVRDWFKDEHVVRPYVTRDLFALFPDEPFVLNPNCEYGKYFTAFEIKRLLAGQFEDSQTTVLAQPEAVLLAHPKEIPHALIAALGRELGAVKSVRGAWLMLASRAGAREQSWMLGVDHDGPWQDVSDAIDRVIAGDVLKERLLDAMPLTDNSVSSTLRTGITVVAETRSFPK
jgi:hypothetical protein